VHLRGAVRSTYVSIFHFYDLLRARDRVPSNLVLLIAIKLQIFFQPLVAFVRKLFDYKFCFLGCLEGRLSYVVLNRGVCLDPLFCIEYLILFSV